MTALSLESVTVRHHGQLRPALDEVSLSVAPGEVLAILGESGSGKSTLLHALLGLVPLSRGVIRWNGVDLTSLPPQGLRRLRRNVQPVFQDVVGSLDPRLSIEHALREPFELHDERVTTASLEALLAEVGLDAEVLSARPTELSVGQCQRVVFARALALQPKVLLLDEPTSALDLVTQVQVLELIARLRLERQLTVVVVTHALRVVQALASRLIVLFDGRVVEEGPAGRVLERALHPVTQGLLGRLEVNAVAPVAVVPGCAFRLRCPRVLAACSAPQPLHASTHDPSHRAACVEVR